MPVNYLVVVVGPTDKQINPLLRALFDSSLPGRPTQIGITFLYGTRAEIRSSWEISPYEKVVWVVVTASMTGLTMLKSPGGPHDFTIVVPTGTGDSASLEDHTIKCIHGWPNMPALAQQIARTIRGFAPLLEEKGDK